MNYKEYKELAKSCGLITCGNYMYWRSQLIGCFWFDYAVEIDNCNTQDKNGTIEFFPLISKKTKDIDEAKKLILESLRMIKELENEANLRKIDVDF